MAICLENVLKFFEDHPELSDRKEEVLTKAREKAEEGDIIAGGNIEEIFGDLASLFEI